MVWDDNMLCSTFMQNKILQSEVLVLYILNRMNRKRPIENNYWHYKLYLMCRLWGAPLTHPAAGYCNALVTLALRKHTHLSITVEVSTIQWCAEPHRTAPQRCIHRCAVFCFWVARIYLTCPIVPLELSDTKKTATLSILYAPIFKRFRNEKSLCLNYLTHYFCWLHQRCKHSLSLRLKCCQNQKWSLKYRQPILVRKLAGDNCSLLSKSI